MSRKAKKRKGADGKAGAPDKGAEEKLRFYREITYGSRFFSLQIGGLERLAKAHCRERLKKAAGKKEKQAAAARCKANLAVCKKLTDLTGRLAEHARQQEKSISRSSIKNI